MNGALFVMKDNVALALASVAVVLFALAAVYLSTQVRGMQEPDWSRYVYLLGGIEAIAFAAAGWLWGREVHRGQSQAAEARAKQAEETARTKGEDAARQKQRVESLAAAVLTSTAAPHAATATSLSVDASETLRQLAQRYASGQV